MPLSVPRNAVRRVRNMLGSSAMVPSQIAEVVRQILRQSHTSVAYLCIETARAFDADFAVGLISVFAINVRMLC